MKIYITHRVCTHYTFKYSMLGNSYLPKIGEDQITL